MPSRIEENKYEIMDLLFRINLARNNIKENALQIEQILASGVITQEEDFTVRTCRRMIEFSSGLLASYKYYLSWCMCAEGLSDEERIEAERKAYLLHQAAWACMQEQVRSIRGVCCGKGYTENGTQHALSLQSFGSGMTDLIFEELHAYSDL
ncbi:hypothetical protein QC760_009850 [Botrytis cinerea]